MSEKGLIQNMVGALILNILILMKNHVAYLFDHGTYFKLKTNIQEESFKLNVKKHFPYYSCLCGY